MNVAMMSVNLRLPGTGGTRSSPAVSRLQQSPVHWIEQQLLAFAARHGFYSGIYVHLGHGFGREGAYPTRFAASSVIAARQFADSLLRSSIAQRAACAHRPFAWAGDEAMVEISDRTHAGVAVPVQDYAAGPAFVALIGTDAECARRLAVEVAPSLMAAAADLHAEAQQVLAPATYRRDASALTLREIEVLRLAALGLSCLESGKALGITPRTVEFHLKNAGEKLGAVNKIHAVAIAVSAGWISLS